MRPADFTKVPAEKNPPRRVSAFTTIFNPAGDPLAGIRSSLLTSIPVHPPSMGIETEAPRPAPPGLRPAGLPGLALRAHMTSNVNLPAVRSEGILPGKGQKGIGRPEGKGSDTENFYALDLESHDVATAVDRDLQGGMPIGVVSRDRGDEDTNYKVIGGGRRYPGDAPPIRDRMLYPGHGTFSFPVPLTPRSTTQLAAHVNEQPVLEGHRLTRADVERRVHAKMRTGLPSNVARDIPAGPMRLRGG